ncbi:putative disease resistance protein RGA3 [Tripterygium wilfordii]|uniref:putative disease resistance protein RGA3 n=1 Tax=Tripterygium wilfordii TaxID=458696 RepID=UPI0018F82DCB|nr:putative disease resistance protein RGA3 [Tripterygium wilfordii]
MIETILFRIAGDLSGKIGSRALRRVFLAWGLASDLKRLEENLSTIKAVLLDAEEKKTLNHELRLWLGRLKDVCYDAQDILDELEYEVLRKQVLKQYGSTKSKVRRFFSASNQPLLRLKMSLKIKKLRERLDEIAAQKSKFHLTELVDYRSVVPRETDSLVHSTGVIGRQKDKEIIVTSFLQADGKGMGGAISVLPIVGMGGMGKTTFAKILYNDERVEEYFQLRIWVWVSEKFDKKQILVKMIKSLTNQNCNDLDQDQLQICVRENLKSKRFLLVLDDMWCDDRAKWIELVDVLEGGADRSRVIVTTRSNSVAKIVGTVPTYNLRGLPDQDCVSLFKKWAFKEGEGEYSPKLMEIGNDIVKKCRGLPLAIKTLGSLLYSKNDEHYWEFIRDNEIWKLEQKETDILPALRISYDEMPSYLKPCFAFCSLSRKGYLHNSDWLALVWMAQGFLQPADGNQDPEDIAMQYIKEMHSRSLLQDFYDHSSFVTFKMHDLMHDLASSAGQTECAVVNYEQKSIPKGLRHLALSNRYLIDKEDPTFLQDLNSLQTMIFNFKAQGPILESFFNRFISTCRHLRVLQFKDSSFEVLPSSIGDLKHLRVLNLSGNRKIKKLPDSICKLHNLLYLSVYRCTELEELPRDIRNMVRLRCLFVTIKQNRLANDGIGCLKSLRTLCIGESENIDFLLQGVQHLTSLCELRILRCTNLKSLPLNLKNLKGLKHLEIGTCAHVDLREWDDDEDIKLRLQSLILFELPQLVTLPSWLQSSSKTLQSIKINACQNFSSLPDWLQNLTSLRRLYIESCPRLCKLPRWIPHLTALESLTIKSCQALSERFKEKTNEDWQKIAHVSNVRLYDIDI